MSPVDFTQCEDNLQVPCSTLHFLHMSTRYKRIGCCSVQAVFKLNRIYLSAHMLKLIRSSTPTGAIPIVLVPKARYAIL